MVMMMTIMMMMVMMMIFKMMIVMMMILGYCIDNDKIVDCKYGDYNNDDVDAL